MENVRGKRWRMCGLGRECVEKKRVAEGVCGTAEDRVVVGRGEKTLGGWGEFGGGSAVSRERGGDGECGIHQKDRGGVTSMLHVCCGGGEREGGGLGWRIG